jgi:DNA repair exonuclease SbcCD ATPase subunit
VLLHHQHKVPHRLQRYRQIFSGEKRRADICVAQAMFDLIRSFGRKPFDLLIYDEPFAAGLDDEGIERIIDLLQETSKNVGTVLVVSHIPQIKGICQNSITVVKEEDGTSHVE